MSIDVDIVPTSPTLVCGGEIITRLRENLTASDSQLLGESPGLVELRTKQPLAPDRPLALKTSYYFHLAIQNTLGIMAFLNTDNIEVDYLEDYGRNLDRETIRTLAERWRKAGHHYEITSFAGRGPHELRILVALAAALADACQGYVILMDDNFFDLDVGVYTPEQFKQATPVRPEKGRWVEKTASRRDTPPATPTRTVAPPPAPTRTATPPPPSNKKRRSWRKLKTMTVLDEQITDLAEPIRRRFACACAAHVSGYYKAVYPTDQRLDEAIATAQDFALGQATGQQLLQALASVEAARDAAKEKARAIQDATWDAWRNDPRQWEPPPLSREDAEDLPRDIEWWRRREARMKADGRAAAWLVTDPQTRQRWIALHAAWFAAETAYWAAWLDADYVPEVLAVVGQPGLADARYAYHAAHYAACCPTEAAALAALDGVEPVFLSYHRPNSKYSADMERARQAVIAEQQAWQLRALETHRAQDAALVKSRCSDQLNSDLTRMLLTPPDGQVQVAQDALLALLALDCDLDPLALVQALDQDRDVHFRIDLVHALTTTVTEQHEDVAWSVRYQVRLTEALLQRLSTSGKRPHYGTYAQLLCTLGDRRVLDVLRRDFKAPAGKRGVHPSKIVSIVGSSGFADALNIVAEFLPASPDDLTRLSIARAYAEITGAAAVDFIINQVYPLCKRDGSRALALLSEIHGLDAVQALAAHLGTPNRAVQTAVLRALYQNYRPGELERPAPAHVLEAIARLIVPEINYFFLYGEVLTALTRLGGKAALPYLEAARQRVTGERHLAAIDRAIANLRGMRE
jgi:hypothetical protein